MTSDKIIGLNTKLYGQNKYILPAGEQEEVQETLGQTLTQRISMPIVSEPFLKANYAGGGGSMLLTPIYFDDTVLAHVGSSTNDLTVATAEHFADFAQALDNDKLLQPVFVDDRGEMGKGYHFGQTIIVTATGQIPTKDLPLEGDYYYLEAGVKIYKIEDKYYIESFDLIKEGHNDESSPMD